ncbi:MULTISPECIES: antiviral reverse transcriptase Drt3b [Idiomarina]|jgi:hypothetical protein|uniref:antiviral reverse transcriptase Drt3b n=1 Tax=Idiomarina TaxID=135575 RepID=UPI000C0B033C|nr:MULTISPECIES: antiviral reverse transcriptase Drt3b [Idiomarina]MAC32334.1 hypothetical protein [Haliea sp.]MAO69230.1 hypothetical protein [Idiomarina sp.]MCJ8316602.1 RNA-directed DNA polymerase [Idiomarina sp.]MDV6314793.1 antiviral reverse transcriptase Drt3b [Idiomarina sp. HP20-50]NQZ15327.1 RNA-directed DNA polymerase [Idiomarina sp.]|tara:strand:- start:1880 stop:3775 length:1896 start_codon:yes stop_codon:yes gene_type:complete
MSKIIKVDTDDKLRALLTDVLPYELPLWYTNHHMYDRFKKDIGAYAAISKIKNPNDGPIPETIPLNYKIFRGDGKSARVLSIMHPFSQVNTCNFYSTYENLIEYYSGKSRNSLRYPHKVSTKFYGKISKSNKSNIGIEMIDDDPKTASSYFKYLKYPFLYRFFESYEHNKLEKRFSGMLQVDISKCFASIYTHTIGWATKGKKLAKQKGKGSFESAFDLLMQNLNYGETNGIIIGPEVSRIFSEIILQQIDIDIIKTLKDKGILIGKHYDFRRYVDDYFIFYKSKEISDTVYTAVSDCLLEYKLHLNESKTEYLKRPFSSSISITKYAIKNKINQVFENRDREQLENSKFSRPDIMANKIISRLKMEISSHNVSYQSISNYLLKSIENKNNKLLEEISSSTNINENHINWLLVDLDVLFFMHAMDIRIRTTDKVARQVERILRYSESMESSNKEVLHKKIFDLLKQAIDIFIDTKDKVYGLETLNLLVTLSLLPKDYKLDPDRLTKYYNSINDYDSFYFKWVTFMIYLKDDDDYSELKSSLIKDALSFIDNSYDKFSCCQFFILFFDFISCPYIDRGIRCDLMLKMKSLTGANYGHNKRDYVLANDFIAPWRDEKYLQKSLDKREFVFAYE